MEASRRGWGWREPHNAHMAYRTHKAVSATTAVSRAARDGAGRHTRRPKNTRGEYEEEDDDAPKRRTGGMRLFQYIVHYITLQYSTRAEDG